MPSRPPTHRPYRLPRDGRPSAARRGYNAHWRRLRLLVLNRDPVCQRCGREPGLHVDHIIAREKGGSDDLSNLQSMCHSCHSIKTAECDGSFGRPRKAAP